MDGTETVNVPSSATCALGGNSIPLGVSVTAAPFTDVTVTMEKYTVVDATDETEVDLSEGITLDETDYTTTFSTTMMHDY